MRPILFNSEMVKAILDGRKTQTRRIVKNKTALEWLSDEVGFNPSFVADEGNHLCPYGQAGDTLWVKETFTLGLCNKSTIAYKATHEPEDLDEGFNERIKWKPSIHMPQWASRITLKIKNLRVERIKDISERDMKAEGVGCPLDVDFGSHCSLNVPCNNHREAFQKLWESIYGEGSWDENPWVWVIEFTVV